MARMRDVREVVAVRLAGWELFALDQLADLMDEHRSDMFRRSIAEFMRQVMREHPEWPLHPAWADTTTPVTVLLDPFGVYELCDGNNSGTLVHYGVNGTPPVANSNETAAGRGWVGTNGFDIPPAARITGCERIALLAQSMDTTVLVRLIAVRPRTQG